MVVGGVAFHHPGVDLVAPDDIIARQFVSHSRSSPAGEAGEDLSFVLGEVGILESPTVGELVLIFHCFRDWWL